MDQLLDAAFQCVIEMCRIHNIDESHAMKHSMDVFHHTLHSYQFHVERFPFLAEQRNVLFVAAIVHDMCDSKYVDESIGLRCIYDRLQTFLTPEEFNHMALILTTMSYSTVKENGYPDLKEWQLGYHIVREADLLSAYDFDRCIMYGMFRGNFTYSEALVNASNIYHYRVLRYIEDRLFITEYGLSTAHELHSKALLNQVPRVLNI